MVRLILIFQSKLNNTRNNDNFHLPKVRTNWGKQRFVYHAIKEFNDLEPSIGEVKSSHIFKTNLKDVRANCFCASFLRISRKRCAREFAWSARGKVSRKGL